MLDTVNIDNEAELEELMNDLVTDLVANEDLVLLQEVNLLIPEANIHVQEVANAQTVK